MPVRKLRNLITALPVEARIYDALGLGEQARWSVERELATAHLELLDLLVRKGTKVRKPLISKTIRPSDREPVRPLSMSHPRARAFFGGNIAYTPKPVDGDEGP